MAVKRFISLILPGYPISMASCRGTTRRALISLFLVLLNNPLKVVHPYLLLLAFCPQVKDSFYYTFWRVIVKAERVGIGLKNSAWVKPNSNSEAGKV
jgi:hypothetical protein